LAGVLGGPGDLYGWILKLRDSQFDAGSQTAIEITGW